MLADDSISKREGCWDQHWIDFPVVGTGLGNGLHAPQRKITCAHIRDPCTSSRAKWNFKRSEEEELVIFTVHKTWTRRPGRPLEYASLSTV